MNNLKCLKHGFNNKLICKKDKNRIPFKNCANCPYKEYKCTISSKNCAKSPLVSGLIKRKLDSLKKKSKKLTKLERERTSLFTDDLDHCIICGKSPVNKHEIFGERNKLNSIKYKLVITLCTCEHHNHVECKGIHFDKDLRDE